MCSSLDFKVLRNFERCLRFNLIYGYQIKDKDLDITKERFLSKKRKEITLL